MHRISANSKVRRRLFPEENGEEQSRNFTKILEESAARERQEKSKKWNFDFLNEVPLAGDYEWFRKNGDEWIGIKVKSDVPKDRDFDSKEKIKFLTKQVENEKTPVQLKGESVPLIRKRKNDENVSKEYRETDKVLKNQFGNEMTPAQKRRTDLDNRTRRQGVKRKVDFDHCSYLRRLEF